MGKKPVFRLFLSLFVLLPFHLLFQVATPDATGGEILRVSGKTMGTFYQVTLASPGDLTASALEALVSRRLQVVNTSMSIFDPASEISVFNTAGAGVDLGASPDFLAVLRQAQELYRLTNGAWDGTVKPLVDLWGFGTKKPPASVPDQGAIESLMGVVGFHLIELRDGAVRKTRPGVTLDLGSIAKGYGVDCVAGLLRERGYKDYIVEIGGEVITSGGKTPNTPWKIGISRPEKVFSHQTLHRIVLLRDKAMATSGDYRNYITLGGKDYSHIMDPRTGYPITSGVVSASVISDTCTVADGLATALMVMGPEKGMELVNRLPETECLIIIRDRDGSLRDFASAGFDRFLAN
jgi:thiamine biosynthesis lipoprotein